MGREHGHEGTSGKICLDCGWSVRVEEVDDASKQAIEHFLETGHAIESIDHLILVETDR